MFKTWFNLKLKIILIKINIKVNGKLFLYFASNKINFHSNSKFLFNDPKPLNVPFSCSHEYLYIIIRRQLHLRIFNYVNN